MVVLGTVVAVQFTSGPVAHAAETTEYCRDVDERTRFVNAGAITLTFPKFDASVGELTSAVVTTTMSARWDDRGEIDSNDNGNPYTITATRSATATVDMAGLFPPQEVTASATYVIDDLQSEESVEAPFGTDADGNDVPNDDGFRNVGQSGAVEQTNAVSLSAVVGAGDLEAVVSGTGVATFAGVDNAVLLPSTFVTGQVCVAYTFDRYVSVGDYTWVDVDRDGVQDADEPPLGGVEVSVTSADGPVGTFDTTSAGAYAFVDLFAATEYLVGFEPPNGWWPTVANVGGDDTVDSDIDAVRSVAVVTPAAGDNRSVPTDDNTVDAGFVSVDLALTKAVVGSEPVMVGGTVSYELQPVNVGPTDALAGWSVTEVVPDGTTLISMSGEGYDCDGVTCVATGRLAAGASAEPVVVELRLDAADASSAIRNVAYVSPAADEVEEVVPLGDPPAQGTDTDETATNNDAHVDVTPAVYDLSLVKTVESEQVAADELAIFTVLVRNDGNVDSGPFTVRDHVPADVVVEFVSGEAAIDGETIDWSHPGLAPGDTAEFTLALDLPGDGTFENVAEIVADSGESFGGDIDSVADGNPDNDALVDASALPDAGFNDPSVDEDDHDVATVERLPAAVTTTSVAQDPPLVTLPATGGSDSPTIAALAGLLLLSGLAAVTAARRRPSDDRWV